jgi:hypothetical protein
MGTIEAGYACADVQDFNALLLNWLGELTEKTIAGDTGFKKDFITVPIGGVECGLSGDTTRDGVTDYLIALEFDEPIYSVVANQNGYVNRVVIGQDRKPIPGFYLYTRDTLQAPTTLEEGEWPRGNPAPREDRRSAAITASKSASSTVIPWKAPALTTASAADLLALQGALLAELRARKILRTNNPPVGDYAEWLVAHALGGVQLEANSTKSYDLEAAPYGRIQVKGRVLSTPGKSGQRQTSPFRSANFDHAALVLISDVDFSVTSAVLLPVAVVKERWNWRQHVKGWTLMMNSPTMTHPAAIDITEGLRHAAASLG